MDLQLLVLLLLTATIHFIGTCAYAFRIAAVRTGQIAVAFALFNVLVIVSRTSNSFQAPLIAKRVENALLGLPGTSVLADLRLVLLAAFIATLAAGLLVPALQRLATIAVTHFKQHRSLLRMLWHGCGPAGFRAVASSLARPRIASIRDIRPGRDMPVHMIGLNIAANALWTVSVMACIYAGYLDPDYRLTAMSLSAVINGVATMFLFLVLDPYIAVATDEAAHDSSYEARFRRIIVWMILTRALGTLLAQLLLIPSAYLIVRLAEVI